MQNIYTDGTYLESNPTWHEEDSPWKATQIRRMLEKRPLQISAVAEIGCGVGGIIAELRRTLPENFNFYGFDIAEPAIALAKKRECDRLSFYQEDLLKTATTFDLLLIMDVIEHVPDYLGFLEACRQKAEYKIYHIPLDIHVSSVLRTQFSHVRKTIGHIHYFTAESALASLTDTNHEIIDFFYTDGAVALSQFHPSLKRRLANIPRRLISTVSTEWAARILGGYSLMVLAK